MQLGGKLVDVGVGAEVAAMSGILSAVFVIEKFDHQKRSTAFVIDGYRAAPSSKNWVVAIHHADADLDGHDAAPAGGRRLGLIGGGVGAHD